MPLPKPLRNIRLDSLLFEQCGLKREQVDQASQLNQNNHLGLLPNLKQLGYLTDRQLVDAEAAFYGNRIINLKRHPLNPETIEIFPADIREKYQLLPISQAGNILTVVTASLSNAQAILPELQKLTPLLIDFVLAYPQDILEKTRELQKSSANLDDLLEGKAKELTLDTIDSKKLIEDPNGPVAQVITHLMAQAVGNGASDIHFEPQSTAFRVRFREDGILREVRSFDKMFVPAFSAAIKVMAGLDIAETRLPQDGAISQLVSGRKIDFRVATYPTEYGEKIVLRILDSNKDWISLEALSLHPDELKKLIDVVESPQGLILVAGPTGSGKTSTLYAILKHLNTPTRNILTIEDPIEYRIAGINQAQINSKKGFVFATGLRAMLRLDPNVILVGEIRDKETAHIGVEAALTGHLVLSTIHTNSASQTISRLIELGVEGFVVASGISAVIAQRLLRQICARCKVSYEPGASDFARMGYKGEPVKMLYRGRGCPHCRGEGYRGRIAVMEILVIYNDMRPIINTRAEVAGPLFEMARKHGMRTIHEDAFTKAQKGLTTLDEIVRVLGKWK